MQEATLIHQFTPDQIKSLFDGLQNQLTELKENFQPKTPTEYFTRAEVAQLLKCDLSTIHNWTKKGKLKAYGIGNRVYYKRAEIETTIIPLK